MLGRRRADPELCVVPSGPQLFRIRPVGDDGEQGAFCRECGTRLPIVLPRDAATRIRPSIGVIQSIYDASNVPRRHLHK